MLLLSVPLETPIVTGGGSISSGCSSTGLILDTLDPMMMLLIPAIATSHPKEGFVSLSLKHLTGRLLMLGRSSPWTPYCVTQT